MVFSNHLDLLSSSYLIKEEGYVSDFAAKVKNIARS